MFLKANFKGENASELTKTAFKKKPGTLYVPNEKVIDEVKQKYLDKENVFILKEKETGTLLRKEVGRIETQAMYTKVEDNEVGILMFSLANSLDFSFDFGGYINPQEYSAGSLFGKQIQDTYRSAVNYEGQETYEIEAEICPLFCHMRNEKLQKLFEDCGFETEVESATTAQDIALDNTEYFSKIRRVKLKANSTIGTFFRKIIILLTVCNNQEDSQFVNKEISNKYVRLTDGWIQDVDCAEKILNTLLGKTNLLEDAQEKLNLTPQKESVEVVKGGFGDENGTRLHDVVLQKVLDVIDIEDGFNIVDYGCGNGNLAVDISMKAYEQGIKNVTVVGLDSNLKAIDAAKTKVMKIGKKNKDAALPAFMQGSLLYTDKRVCKADVALLIEVIEHNPLTELDRILDNVFYQDPHKVIITTPNFDFNPNFFNEEYPNKNPQGFRHQDHRFEFNEKQFKDFFLNYINHDMYSIEFSAIGKVINGIQPTLMVVITKKVWRKPEGFNTDYDYIQKLEAAQRIYDKKKKQFDEYTINPELYVKEKELAMEKAKKEHEEWLAMKLQQRAERKKRIAEAGQFNSVNIDPLYVGNDKFELLNKAELAIEDEEEEEIVQESTKRYKIDIPEEPKPPFEENIIIDQAGCAFKKNKVFDEFEEFVKHKCKTVEEVNKANELYKEMGGNMKEFRSSYWKWFDQKSKNRKGTR